MMQRRLLYIEIKKIVYSYLLFFSLQSVVSCNYEFSEDYFVDIEKPGPNAEIILDDFVNGTILTSSKDIFYEYEDKGIHQLDKITVFVDGRLMINRYTKTGGFNINIDTLKDGQHTLQIEYVFSSGSGSYVDSNYSEIYTKKDEYLFTVERG